MLTASCVLCASCSADLLLLREDKAALLPSFGHPVAGGARLNVAKDLLGHALQELLQLQLHGLGAVCIQLAPFCLIAHPHACTQCDTLRSGTAAQVHKSWQHPPSIWWNTG